MNNNLYVFKNTNEAIPFINKPCLILDGLKDYTLAYIEGIDIVLDKIIVERVNYEPLNIGVLIDEQDLKKINFDLSNLQELVENSLSKHFKE